MRQTEPGAASVRGREGEEQTDWHFLDPARPDTCDAFGSARDVGQHAVRVFLDGRGRPVEVTVLADGPDPRAAQAAPAASVTPYVQCVAERACLGRGPSLSGGAFATVSFRFATRESPRPGGEPVAAAWFTVVAQPEQDAYGELLQAIGPAVSRWISDCVGRAIPTTGTLRVAATVAVSKDGKSYEVSSLRVVGKAAPDLTGFVQCASAAPDRNLRRVLAETPPATVMLQVRFEGSGS